MDPLDEAIARAQREAESAASSQAGWQEFHQRLVARARPEWERWGDRIAATFREHNVDQYSLPPTPMGRGSKTKHVTYPGWMVPSGAQTMDERNPGDKWLLLTSGLWGTLEQSKPYGPLLPTPRVLGPGETTKYEFDHNQVAATNQVGLYVGQDATLMVVTRHGFDYEPLAEALPNAVGRFLASR